MYLHTVELIAVELFKLPGTKLFFRRRPKIAVWAGWLLVDLKNIRPRPE